MNRKGVQARTNVALRNSRVAFNYSQNRFDFVVKLDA